MVAMTSIHALNSLQGLALGDALGSQFFVPANLPYLKRRELPPGPWQWTDDAEMACSVFAVLHQFGRIDQDALATSFADHHDFDRGYGPAMNRLLRLVRQGGSWRSLASDLFDGQGSWGNGGAMRVAPLGAWFADDPAEAARQAALSASVTHTHPEGVSGAIAVAVAASLAAGPDLEPADFLSRVLDHVPPGQVHDGIQTAQRLAHSPSADLAAYELGNGRHTSAHDTVPFALWVAAHHLTDYEQAFWTTPTRAATSIPPARSSAGLSLCTSESRDCPRSGSLPANHFLPGRTQSRRQNSSRILFNLFCDCFPKAPTDSRAKSTKFNYRRVAEIELHLKPSRRSLSRFGFGVNTLALCGFGYPLPCLAASVHVKVPMPRRAETEQSSPQPRSPHAGHHGNEEEQRHCDRA